MRKGISMVSKDKNIKKRILFNISNVKQWIGGIYYIKSIVELFLISDNLKSSYEIILIVDESQQKIFVDIEKDISIIVSTYNNKYLNSLLFAKVILKNRVDFWYAISFNFIERIFKKKAIFWIPDFQYLYFPQFFSTRELKNRKKRVQQIAEMKNSLILSSNSAKMDFLSQYSRAKCECFVVHFTSNIGRDIRKITKFKEKKILRELNLDRKYVYIPNQFWQHKNHIVVLKAIKELLKKEKFKNSRFVFTGEMSDYRNSQYMKEIKLVFEDKAFRNNLINLGFMDRMEQLIVMKNADFIIQPSLFEGWGTVLEDAKVMDKTVLLSDIEVHREQMYEKCILFDPYDAAKLAVLLEEMIDLKKEDNLEKGLNRLESDMQRYSKELEKCLINKSIERRMR